MVWRRLIHPDDDSGNRDTAEQHIHQAPDRAVPPHIAEQLNLRPSAPPRQADLRRRLARLQNQREQTRYDIEQGELALAEDNPWKQRIALLTETLETVEADHARAAEVQPGPYWQVPAVPIGDLAVTVENDVATVRYTLGDQRFVYEEPLDWAERGHTIARTELQRVHGDPAAALPEGVPADLREALLAHLDHSLFVFATVLRDARLDDEPLPGGVTLDDLAKPCPTCGGWTDYRGRCQACARRKASMQELFQERGRLLNERAAEIEEQHRMTERLPLARNRLRDLDAEIAALEAAVAEAGNAGA